MIDNDKRVLELKKQIEEKRNKLNGTNKFSPITNCILDFDGVKINIQVLKIEQLKLLACKLQSYKRSAEELKFEISISGYKVDEWLEDILSKINILSVKYEEIRLKEMESKLTTLLTNEKKVELEIDEIENMLK